MKVRPPRPHELTDCRAAYEYAMFVVRGRFPEGEAAIATSPYYAYEYAYNVLKGRFPAGEAIIFDGDSNPIYSYTYPKMLRRDDPEGYSAFQLERGDWIPDKIADKAVESARSRAPAG